MQKFLLSFLLLVAVKVQSQNWTWISCADTINKSGIYGTLGVPSVTNYPGGREGSVTWKDATGNLWLFGGNGYSAAGALGYLNDLWKFNPGTGQWTWVKGSNTINQLGAYGTMTVASGTNIPGGRYYPTSWTDASGNFWLFGGWGYSSVGAAARLNDLWKYDPGTNQWTWMKGSNATNQVGIYGTLGVPSTTTVPGARYDLVSWIDGTNNLWLFGGAGYGNVLGVGDLSDVWKYNPVTNQWTWMKGPKIVNQSAITGTMGVTNSTNTPGGMHNAVSWMDAAGDFYLFGGNGYNYQGGVGSLNDIWKYNSGSSNWTWMKGSGTINQNGVYGVKGISSLINNPGGRYLSAAWIDLAGDVHLFGGTGFPKNGAQGNLNDLWKYNSASTNWAWVGGTDTVDVNGIYGTKGVSTSTNQPGSRYVSSTWRDNTGNFWMFGGGGLGKSGTAGYLNDLWKYDVCLAPATPTNITSALNTTVCSGKTTTLNVAAGTGTVSWFTTPTTTASVGTGTTYVTPPLSTGNYTYYAEAATCTASPRAMIMVTVVPSPVILATSTSASLCAGEPATLTVSGADTYTWNTGANTTSITVTPTTTITYTATGTSTVNGCWKQGTVLIIVDPCVGIYELGVKSSEFGVFPNPNNGTFTLKIGAEIKKGEITILNSLGQIVYKQNVVQGINPIKINSAARGIYTFVLLDNKQEIRKGKIVID